jgi:myo-inositol 2-dehydrogenase / D-chiro-inositol 1-dehydrogenase
VAVCDVDASRARDGQRIVENWYASRAPAGSYRGCDVTGDYREIIERKDVDAVCIVTPDHWHAIPAIAAARSGKDIFIQKPLTLTIPEGRLLSDTVQRYGRVLQVGSQQRSSRSFRFACELVRNGRIGQLQTVRVGLPGDPPGVVRPPTAVPEGLDYEFWLGPAPYVPYIEDRVHPRRGYDRPGWLRTSDYCCGMITGWGTHHVDIAHWGMGAELTGPVEIHGTTTYPADGVWDVHGDCRIEYTYADGVKLIVADSRKHRPGVVFEGSQGWVYCDRGALDAHPRSLLTSVIGPNEIHLHESNSHKADFLRGMRTRGATVAPVEAAHRSCTACVLGYIAMKLQRPLRWDPAGERFAGADDANRMLNRPLRGMWQM